MLLWRVKGSSKTRSLSNDHKAKQLKEQMSLQFAGLGEVPMSQMSAMSITAANDQGLINIHDRKPSMLSSDYTRECVDLESQCS